MSTTHNIYHITSVKNLRNILLHKALWCDSERAKYPYDTVNIAHQDLKQRRSITQVPVGAKGVLADYVPFYFCNRSPMLYAIYKGGVTNCEETQPNIIYLVSTAEKVAKEGLHHWCFSDGHGVDRLTAFYDDLKELTNIDWGLIENWHWNNTQDDNDKKRKKQAEFLVHRSFPIEWIEKIAVYNEMQKKQVESTLSEYPYKIPVAIEKKWYYSTRGHS